MAKKPLPKPGYATLTTTEKPLSRFETLKAEHRKMLDRRCPYLTPAQRDLAAHEAASRVIYDITGEGVHMDPWAPLSPLAPTVIREEITAPGEAVQLLTEQVNTALAAEPWNALDLAIGREVYPPSPFRWDTATFILVRDRFRNAGWVVNIIATDEQTYFRFVWPTEQPDPTADINIPEY